jgi:inorganic pyrophosphatase
MRLTMIVEWSLGSQQRFDWDGEKLIVKAPPRPAGWEVPPVNYGQIPGYLNPADGAALDAIWTGRQPAAPGALLEGEVLGMVWVNDGDHKIILGEPGSLKNLDQQGLDTWFAGREPRFVDAQDAIKFIKSITVQEKTPDT